MTTNKALLSLVIIAVFSQTASAGCNRPEWKECSEGKERKCMAGDDQMVWKLKDNYSGMCANAPEGFYPDERVVVEVTFEDDTVDMGM